MSFNGAEYVIGWCYDGQHDGNMIAFRAVQPRMSRIEYLTLRIKVKDEEDFDEN